MGSTAAGGTAGGTTGGGGGGGGMATGRRPGTVGLSLAGSPAVLAPFVPLAGVPDNGLPAGTANGSRALTWESAPSTWVLAAAPASARRRSAWAAWFAALRCAAQQNFRAGRPGRFSVTLLQPGSSHTCLEPLTEPPQALPG
ncbi:hypothetical protein GCM10023321_50800 [Pseudonocardia eucalypti]|uniref:Uncharacterized protein n=1 Tax=Pseudonocardia eucalypti TaxID=648755 RepID=A0ABP9QKV3_9PSEU